MVIFVVSKAILEASRLQKNQICIIFNYVVWEDGMSNNSTQQNSGNGFFDLIFAVVAIIIMVFLFKYIWHGLVWLFDTYVKLLKVN